MKMIVIALGVSLVAGSSAAACSPEVETDVRKHVSGFDCETEPGVCRGTFDLGAPASRDSFEVLRGKLDGCSESLGNRDQGVNHPDFYDAWHFVIDGAPVTLSIKDKTALKKTFVVLRGAMSETLRN